MKKTILSSLTRRAAAFVLALATLVPSELMSMPARAAEIKSTETKIVVWDWIDDMQSIGKGADYDPANESKAIPVGQTKYSRIMFYQNVGGDRYYFNADPNGGPGGKGTGYYTSYEASKVYLDANSRVGSSSNNEWSADMVAAENGGSFITLGGVRTPYIQYVEVKKGYHAWRLWSANKDDTWSKYALLLEDDYEHLNVRLTDGFALWSQTHYGADDKSYRADPWIIDHHCVVAPAANYETTHDDYAIWHWDNDSGQWNEALDFDVGNRRFKEWAVGNAAGIETFKIFLGKEYKVGTLAENYTVPSDQVQTLGKPLYYIPKGKTITVEKDATLVIDGALLNDGMIVVKEGGLLKLKDGAKILPMTRQDSSCGKIDSSGSIIVGTDALLCGGANNGVRISKGGVVNFGIICGESILFERNDLIDNRVDDNSDNPGEGWIIAGRSPTSAARARLIKEAIANEGVTAKMDRSKDFGKVTNGTKSNFTTQAGSVYGDGAEHVDTTGVGETGYGSVANPTISVYIGDKPGDSGTALFENELLDDVSLRVDGTKATYTVREETHTVENKLLSAVVSRGTEKLTLFRDMWIGKLDGAYVQLEPASAAGKCLALYNNGTGNGTNVVLYDRSTTQTNKGQWWKLVADGKSGLNTAYVLESVSAGGKVLDLPGDGAASSGNNIQLYAKDSGTDQRWILIPDAYDPAYYYIRNTANTGVSLNAENTGNNANVGVASNSTNNNERWKFVNLFDEDSYSASVEGGIAIELIPQNAAALRLDLNGTNDGAGAVVTTADGNSVRQRWELQQAGTEAVNGVTTPFFRIVNKETQTALTVNGDYKSETGVVAKAIQSGKEALPQYWYLEESGGVDKYYVSARGNTAFLLQASGAGSGSAVQIDTRKENTNSQIWDITGGSSAMTQAGETARKAEDDPFYGKVFTIEASTVSGYYLHNITTWQQESIVSISKAPSGSSVGTIDGYQWSIRYLGIDDASSGSRPYYQIIPAVNEGYALGAYQGKTQDWQYAAQQAADASSKAQHWYITENTDGTYTIAPRNNDKLTLGYEATEDVNPALRGTYNYLAMLCSGEKTATKQIGFSKATIKYGKLTWKIAEVVKDPLDGKTFTIESVGKPGWFISPYGATENYARGDYGEVVEGAGGTPYGRWTFKQLGVKDGKPYFSITSAHSGKVLLWEKPYADVYTITSSSPTGEGYRWFVQANSDGTVSLLPYGDNKKAVEPFQSGSVYWTRVSALGSSPTDNQKWKLTASTSVDFLDGKVFYLWPTNLSSSNRVLDLCGNGTADGTQVQIYDKKETEIQRWRFQRIGVESVNGKPINVYVIHSVYAEGKVLDTSGSTDNGARPHLWTYSTSNKNQKWIVEDAGNGSYYIIPREDTTKYLGVQNDSTANNAAVDLGNSSGNSRKWKLTETIVPETMGTYSILPKHAPGMHVGLASSNSDNGTKLIIWEYNESSNYARWTFVKMGTDGKGAYYKIVNMANGKVIDATGINAIQADSQLQQWDSDFNNDQLWYLNDAGQDENGIQYYNIVNRCDTNYCMSVSGGSTTHGTGVTVSKKNGGDSQKFRLMERFEPVELGTYEFGNPDAISMRLTVAGGSASDGANIILYARHTNNANAGGKLQQFKIIQRGNDVVDGVKTPYYSIENLNGGKVLDPTGNANVSDGTNVLQWSYDGFSDQHWYMEVREDSSVVFRCRADSRLVLTATGTNSDDNVALKTYDEKNLGRQSWQLHPIMQTNAAGQYYIPGNKAAVAAGIPFAKEEDDVLNPAVGGKYTLAPQHAATSRMDLAGGNTGNGTRIQLYGNRGNDNQRWQFVPMGVDYYDGGGKIFYKLAFGSNANKVAQIDGYGPVTASKNVSLYDDQGCYDDEWYLEPVGGKEDTYYIIGRGTWSQEKKICLGVPSGATADQTQLQTATLQNKNYQQWQLEYVD